MSRLDFDDGHRGQASMDRGSDSSPEYNLFGYFLECLVVDVRFPGDAHNVTGFIEYDCDPLIAGVGRIANCVRLEAITGVDDGDENTLRASDATVDGGQWAKDSTDQRYQGNGDHVIVTFLNGSKDRPIIVGCYPNPLSKVTRQQGSDRIRRITHRGTVVTIDGTGNVEIDLNDANKTIKIGSGGASEPLVLGNVLVTALTELLTQNKLMSPVGPCVIDPTWKATYLDNADTNILAKKKYTEK